MEATLQAVLAAIASFFIITFLFVLIFILYRRTSEKTRPSELRHVVPGKPTTKKQPELNSIVTSESAVFDQKLNRVSVTELLQATGDFSPDLIVGDGSFGLVYKAKLSTGVVVAVKRLAADAFQGVREFRAEMETLSKIRHPNIVKILGYCAAGPERVLVYEFIERGGLDQWLYDMSAISEEQNTTVARLPLCWDTRINIIKGVAEGLAYLHNLATPIIHRDIKASNILLDNNFSAHIADFGLARTIEGSRSYVSTQMAGTMGYIPPEYLTGATKATVIADVYSFGILVLEVLTGRQPHFPFAGEDGEEVRLVEWVKTMMKQNRCLEMVASNVLIEDSNEKNVSEAFRIGIMCANEMGRSRPTMKEVVSLLNNISS